MSSEEELSQDLIRIAIQMINESFTEKHLRMHAIEYVNFKFKQSINFAHLTNVHYCIFREKQLYGEKRELQTIIELFLLAADILDDLQDGDSKSNPWSQVNLENNLNILVGLLLATLKKVETITCSIEVKNFIRNQVYDLLLKSINGQQIDLVNHINLEPEYIEMAMLKSGSLFQLANLLGAGNVSEETFCIIKTYSNYLGIISQIRNDVNDMVNITKSDLLNKKRTLPILYYLYIDDPKFQVVKDYYQTNKGYNTMTELEIKNLLDTLLQGGAIQYCKVVEQIYISKYQESIKTLNISNKARENLLKVSI